MDKMILQGEGGEICGQCRLGEYCMRRRMRCRSRTALIQLDVFIFGGKWGEFNVLLDASERRQGEFNLIFFV